MFCQNCGAQINNTEFCIVCGAKQPNATGFTTQGVSPVQTVETNTSDKKRDVAFWISILLSPFLFIFRMLAQQDMHHTYKKGVWHVRQFIGLPGSLKAVAFLIMFTSVIVAFILNLKSNSLDIKKRKWVIALCVINLLLGFIIILVTTDKY